MGASRRAQTSAQSLADTMDSRFFRALSEPIRIQILKLLMLNGRSDIGSVERNFTQDRSVISRHLRTLQEVGILLGDKQDRHTYYQVNAKVVLEKMELIVEKIRECIHDCCPGS